ncbi:hypothetical protein COU80_04590 [Candidatus Peregrinibacteria bacterium CG10_big_fil_rev_8_21_14_0_10_55_24]|nr:MAG: hypothetical protein COU80_04590 [Candidatus Peregrinibacteria bacterium CG10_big_fil_rev_8_21_14_0_10_55_24]
MKTGIFIGRFQPFHEGHRKCVETILKACDRCIVLMRETPQTEKNPFEFEKRKAMIRAALPMKSRCSSWHLRPVMKPRTCCGGREVFS